MHAPVLLCINQHMKFELSSFTNYKDMIGAKFKQVSAAADRPARRGVSHPPCCTQMSTVSVINW